MFDLYISLELLLSELTIIVILPFLCYFSVVFPYALQFINLFENQKITS